MSSKFSAVVKLTKPQFEKTQLALMECMTWVKYCAKVPMQEGFFVSQKWVGAAGIKHIESAWLALLYASDIDPETEDGDDYWRVKVADEDDLKWFLLALYRYPATGHWIFKILKDPEKKAQYDIVQDAAAQFEKVLDSESQKEEFHKEIGFLSAQIDGDITW